MTSLDGHDDGDIIERFLASGGALHMLADVKQDDLRCVYAHANRLFAANDVAGALNIYQWLATLDQWDFDYWFASGLCQQRLDAHDAALFSFAKAGIIRAADPRPAYLAGHSYLKVGNVEFARKAFAASIRWCGQDDAHADLRQSAETELARLNLSSGVST